MNMHCSSCSSRDPVHRQLRGSDEDRVRPGGDAQGGLRCTEIPRCACACHCSRFTSCTYTRIHTRTRYCTGTVQVYYSYSHTGTSVRVQVNAQDNNARALCCATVASSLSTRLSHSTNYPKLRQRQRQRDRLIPNDRSRFPLSRRASFGASFKRTIGIGIGIGFRALSSRFTSVLTVRCSAGAPSVQCV